MRRNAPSYQADEVTLKHLVTLDGTSPPVLTADAQDKECKGALKNSTSNANEIKGSQLRHCLIPVCARRDGPGIRKVQCRVVLRQD